MNVTAADTVRRRCR